MPKKIYDFDPHNLPSELLAVIGLMTASSAQTESCVESAIAGCLGIDAEYGKALTTHMSAPLRDSILRAVAEIKIDDLDALDELDSLLDAVNNAFAKRNGVVHHTWCRDPENGAIFTVKSTARGSLEMNLIPMTVDQVKSDALLVYNAGMDLWSFLLRHDLIPPTPPVHRLRAHKSKAERKKRRKTILESGRAN